MIFSFCESFLIYIYSGGTTLTFSGSYLNVTQSPVIQIIDARFNATQEVSYKQLYTLNAMIYKFHFSLCSLVIALKMVIL